MHIERLGEKRLRILTPAKVNLFLEVLGKRDDGFHDIETLMCPITLFDVLIIELRSDGRIQFELGLPSQSASRDDPAWNVPSTADNLVPAAVAAVRDLIGSKSGCWLHLEKRIPSAAGLGGGSSDAAAAITGFLALNQCWDLEAAREVGGRLGSDIAFFLGDAERIGLALATGRGERCNLLSFAPPLEFIILHPPVGCATGAIYARHLQQANPRTSKKIVKACENGQIHKIGAELFNALQSPASEVNPWIVRQLDLLAECGYPNSLMSGSGSSCFAIANGTGQAAKIRQRSAEVGIPRVFAASAWFAPPIEEQLFRIASR
jgi:4-diphosphocytidyl-2-C-methyl-D-erythritol kinase